MYGSVYKCRPKGGGAAHALKVMNQPSAAEGLPLATCREVSLLQELSHSNVVSLAEVFLDHRRREVSMLMLYAEYDLLVLIQYFRPDRHGSGRRPSGGPPPDTLVASIMWQMLEGLGYLHRNWVFHRDLKPANVLVMGEGPECGRVKIADLGMARLFSEPLRPLTDVDPVVVTFWYRAPELLLGAKEYTEAVDTWAAGCIFAELLMGRRVPPRLAQWLAVGGSPGSTAARCSSRGRTRRRAANRRST